MLKKQNDDKNTVHVKVPPTVQQGLYSNAVSVTVNKNEIVVDFGYVLPNFSPTTVEVVSRINMTHSSAENFISTLQNAILDHRNKSQKK